MVNQELLEERLVDWSLQRQRGIDVSAEELCKDHPELIPALSEMISELKEMDWLDSVEISEGGGLPLRKLNSFEADAATKLQNLNMSTEEFCQRLIDSTLIDLKTTQELKEQIDPESGLSFANELVSRSLLTRYQATVLLDRREQELVLDRYVILDEIGAGGMGVVYKALHRNMDRIVALKTLNSRAVDTPDKVKRFQREVEAVAKLEHQNIVTAHDAHTSKGVHYLVMSYVDGDDLAAVVRKQGTLSISKAIDCIVQAARGLGHAHEMGIIHRDIKPGNLLLDQNGVVHVLDLGLARFEDLELASVHESSDDLTHSGMVMGTLAYLAPEQAVDTHTADARSDIYSLGCALYYLLTGQAPFTKATAMQTMLAHREAEIPSLQTKRTEVPAELDSVFQKMVSKKPAERFQDMGEVISALEALRINEEKEEHLMSAVASAQQDTDKFQETSVQIVLSEPSSHRNRRSYQTQKPANRSTSTWIIASAVLGLIVLSGLIIKLQTAAGTLILEMDQPDLAGAVVTIDGEEKITIKTGQGDEKIEIKPDAKKHVLEVMHPEFKKFTKKFEFKTADDKTIKIRLEPKQFDLVAAGKNFEAVVPDVAQMNKNAQADEGNAEDNVAMNEKVVLAAGEGNFALQFDGVNDYVDLGEEFRFDPNQPLTMEAWIRIDGNIKAGPQGMITSQPFHLGTQDHKNKWQILVRDLQFGGALQASVRSRYSAVLLGQTHHFAAVWQGNQPRRLLKLFVNGKLIGDYELSVPLVFHKDSGIMQYLGMSYLWKSSPYGCFNGVMDEVRISNVARYEHDFNPATKFNLDRHTLALYHFDEGAGNELKDSSGNEHHGIIHGAKWYHHAK